MLQEETLTDDQIAATTLHDRPSDVTGHLLPGRSPGRPRNPAGLSDAMRLHGIPVRAARSTAMMRSLAELPPIVIADLFVFHPAPLAGGSTSPATAGLITLLAWHDR